MVAHALHGSRDIGGSRILRSVALGFAVMFTVPASAFIAAEALSDPGGLSGFGTVLLWAVPLAGLTVYAWVRPARAMVVLAALTMAVVIVSGWFVANPSAWRSFEDGHGPVRAIAVFVLVLPLAVLGWRRPRPAGWMLLTIGVAPIVVTSTPQGSGSMRAIALPAAVDGILFLLASVSPVESRRSGDSP